MAQEFIGAGISFPLHTDNRGGVALSTHDTEIREAIRLILGTAYGERPMRPEFGCGIHDHVFAPANATTAGRVAHEVKLSLARWEPRVEVIDVDVTYDPHETSTMYIDITYSVLGTNDPRNLVFPFYTIPSEE